MAWWNKIVSAAKSAVSKVISTVKSVAEIIIKPISKKISKVKTAIKKVTSSVVKTVSKTVKKTSSSVNEIKNHVKAVIERNIRRAEAAKERAKDYAKKEAERKVERAKADIERAEKLGDEKLIEEKEAVLKEVQKAEPTWTEKLMGAVKSAFKIKLPLFGLIGFDVIGSVYEISTGKKLTEEEGARLKLKILDWMLPLNTLSKLFTGKNLDGKPEEFGGVGDYANLALSLAIFVPAAKFGKIAGKLGSKGFMKLFATKSDDAIRLFKGLDVAGQTKMLRALTKTDDGVMLINKLLRAKAVRTTLVKPIISIVNKRIGERILIGSGFGALVSRAVKPKTILYGLTGLMGIIGLAYGIPFGTSWMAKEGIKEQFEIPLSDRMRDYRYEPTAEKRELILADIAKLEQALPIAEAQIKSVAWLWPPTKEMWTFYANNLYFEINQYKKELERLIPPELIEIPEQFTSTIRDIIDGDTIDVSLEAEANGISFKLPPYKKTNHARVRIVGINAPEKSPKGEILCTDVEILKVEKKFADEARERLRPLDDKKVILKTDPENPFDNYERILAVVEYEGKDIGLRQIKEGLACRYFREPHKWVDEDEYKAETLKAKEEGIGMWKGLEEIEKEEEKIKIYITSTPSNAKLYLDDVALHHNTPSDEKELSDVMHLLTLGPHILSAEKAGMSAMEDIEIVKGDNGTIHLTLETAPVAVMVVEEEEVPPEEVPPEEVPPEEVPPEEIIPAEPVPEDKIPEVYTADQLWALTTAFSEIWELTKGLEVMSEEERDKLIESFALYTDEQKKVLNLLWQDLTYYTRGTEALSTDEFNALKEKYHTEEM